VALRGSERTTGEQRALPYTGRRRAETPAAPASPAPGDDDLRQAGWIGDYYRRRQLAALIPAKAGTESEYPHLRRPAAQAMASAWAEAEVVPRLAAGVELLGEYQGSGLTKASFLARSPSGQVVHLSRLLYLVLSEIDGHRTVGEIAGRVSVTFGRTVSAANVDYLLANKLTPLGLVAGGAAADGRDPMILSLKLRRTLIPAAGVQHIARLLAPLFAPPVVVVLLGLLATADAWLARSGKILPAFADTLAHPLLLLVVLGLSTVSILFHECGHAAACRYGGARPGRIGFGLYVVWPAAFTNVTDSYRLGRGGRIRVDLGGVYFNAIFAVALAGTYRATGYAPLLAAVALVHMEAVEQLLPSLRFDGYFIMTDLIGVPDLFQRVGPVLTSLIPGRRADPSLRDMRRAARVALTAWVMVMVPLLGGELVLIVLTLPRLAATFSRSMAANAGALVTEFGRGDVVAGLLSVISVLLLAFPAVGLCYILVLTGRAVVRLAGRAMRKRPALRVPLTAAALLAGASLAGYWGVLPLPGHLFAPSHPALTVATSAAGPPRTIHPAHPVRPDHPAGPTVAVLTPVSAHGFDALSSPAADPSDENDDEAAYAIDGNPATAWSTQHYLASPFFGGLKSGTGLILDMGRRVRLRSVTVTFGGARGADVAIEIGNDDTLAAATLSTFITVATADGIGGKHTFTMHSPATGRYVLIWFTRLPRDGHTGYAARIYTIIIRGSHPGRARHGPIRSPADSAR
jgi:putative peptide zinc metalloprotease protein